LGFERQEFVRADQDLTAEFSDRRCDVLVELETLRIDDLAAMDDEISGRGNLIARFNGNDAARATLPASKFPAACSKVAVKKREGLS
jgi:hypothetical protein